MGPLYLKRINRSATEQAVTVEANQSHFMYPKNNVRNSATRVGIRQLAAAPRRDDR